MIVLYWFAFVMILVEGNHHAILILFGMHTGWCGYIEHMFKTNHNTLSHCSLNNKWNQPLWCKSNFQHPVGVILCVMSISLLTHSVYIVIIKTVCSMLIHLNNRKQRGLSAHQSTCLKYIIHNWTILLFNLKIVGNTASRILVHI